MPFGPSVIRSHRRKLYGWLADECGNCNAGADLVALGR